MPTGKLFFEHHGHQTVFFSSQGRAPKLILSYFYAPILTFGGRLNYSESSEPSTYLFFLKVLWCVSICIARKQNFLQSYSWAGLGRNPYVPQLVQLKVLIYAPFSKLHCSIPCFGECVAPPMGLLSEVPVPLSENHISSYVIKMIALRVLKISDWMNINRMSYQFIFLSSSQGGIILLPRSLAWKN